MHRIAYSIGFTLAAILSLAGCEQVTEGNALGVTVTLSQNHPSKCVRVFIQAAEGTERTTDPIKPEGRTELRVAVYRDEGLTADVSVRAEGYPNDGCSGTPNAQSALEAVVFTPSAIAHVTLVLAVLGDSDGDGHPSVSVGGEDCDDANPAIYPGRAEDCANLVDDNCSGEVDCQEASCIGQPCPAGGTCSGDRICLGATEEVDCSDGADNDGNGLTDCEEPSCSGATCKGSDLCFAAQTCQNGQCGGGTPKACVSGNACLVSPGACEPSTGECQFAPATGASCEDGNLCTTGDVCSADGTCAPGAPKECTQIAEECLDEMGTCNPSDGSCSFPPLTGAACDDGNSCTSASTCNDQGQCAPGSQTSCTTPPNSQCFEPTGVCDPSDATCGYDVRVEESCSDGNACTTNDRCDASGSCVGTAACQATKGECYTSSCSVNNGLPECDEPDEETPKASGTPCSGGVCNGSGVCTVVFPFAHSNFTAAASDFSATVNLSCGGTVTIDSSSPPSHSGWCLGVPIPTVRVITQPGGGEALLVAMAQFTLGSSTTLRLVGTRPVILASTNNMTIDGVIEAGSFWKETAFVRGAGASASSECTSGRGRAGTFRSGKGAGTWGGGGGAGFRTAGSEGGMGNTGGLGGAGGAANTGTAATRLMPLRGGCAGGISGDASSSTRVLGGEGGGAVQLTAGGTLTVNGTITAGGAGGRGGSTSWMGGGGGGSGGGILLEANSLSVGANASVTANGGAGGEGDGDGAAAAQNGAPGADGAISAATPATGGTTAHQGGNGGRGGARLTLPSAGANGGGNINPGGGGGGGGGSPGRIHVRAKTACNIAGTSVRSPQFDVRDACTTQ